MTATCERRFGHRRHDFVDDHGNDHTCDGVNRRPGELLPIVAGLTSAVRLELGVMSA